MKTESIPMKEDGLENSRQMIRGFGEHYDYDTGYLEELMDASPAAWRAFEAAMPMARVRKAAPVELVMVAKLAAMHAQEWGFVLRRSRKETVAGGVSRPIRSAPTLCD